MYKMFLRIDGMDDYLGEFETLLECQNVVDKEFDYQCKTNGIKKAQFYALDYKGDRPVCWIMGVKEEW